MNLLVRWIVFCSFSGLDFYSSCILMRTQSTSLFLLFFIAPLTFLYKIYRFEIGFRALISLACIVSPFKC